MRSLHIPYTPPYQQQYTLWDCASASFYLSFFHFCLLCVLTTLVTYKFSTLCRRRLLLCSDVQIQKGNDADFEKPDVYRPISLTNCLFKILEKIINIKLVWYLERNNKISIYQSGFRQRRRTTDHLLQLENTIRQDMAQKRHAIAVLFGIQKAYDSAWNHYIIRKLQQYSFRRHLVHFVKNFHSNRQMKVQTCYEVANLNNGISQGSVLSCTCFMIAINEIANNLPPCLYKTYVDECTKFLYLL